MKAIHFPIVLLALSLCLVSAPAGWKISPLSSADQAWVETTLKGMTLEEKVGQMIFPTLSAVFTNVDSDAFRKIDRNIREYHVGGYHSFSGDPAALGLLVNRMQRHARIPLLMTADLEGGPGYQFANATRIPRAMALGAAGSEDLAYQAGKITALEGRAMGIHVNFYPVVDVNNNPRNPIISIRSFGEDPAFVSRMGTAYIRGAQENGQVATAKHFPGHGDTSVDSHLALPVIDVTPERLNAVELPPFQAAIDSGVGAVMTAHIYIPQMEPELGLPATLSSRMIDGLLRARMGFKGVVFTDAMTMLGVAAHYTPEDATVRAVKAGADVILMPVDDRRSFEAIRNAVKAGDLPLARIEASARRILEVKARLGLHRERFINLERLDTTVGSAEHRNLARTMIERAITLVRDERKVLPLNLDQARKVLLMTIVDSGTGWREGTPGQAFRQELTKMHANVVSVTVDDRTSRDAMDVLKKLADEMDVIIANGFIRVAAYKGSIDMTEAQMDLLRHVSAKEKPFVFTLFGSPYLLSFVPELPSCILAYEYYPEAERAALRAITGANPFTGKLPVSLPGIYPAGHGLQGR